MKMTSNVCLKIQSYSGFWKGEVALDSFSHTQQSKDAENVEISVTNRVSTNRSTFSLLYSLKKNVFVRMFMYRNCSVINNIDNTNTYQTNEHIKNEFTIFWVLFSSFVFAIQKH
jgi:hypothetical protein